MNLAYRMRPNNLQEFFGQEHLVGKGKILRQMIETGNIISLIFWGQPGSGKTTLATIIAGQTESDFHRISAVESGKEELKKVIKKAELNKTYNRKTKTRQRESKGLITSKEGFSVVAPKSVIRLFSTYGNKASCWALFHRCISSINRIVLRL